MPTPKEIRAAALEEAAKVADKAKNVANERYVASPVGIEKVKNGIRFETAADIAKAIHALKEYDNGG
jgi:chromosome segregation and condensation protein ScpB